MTLQQICEQIKKGIEQGHKSILDDDMVPLVQDLVDRISEVLDLIEVESISARQIELLRQAYIRDAAFLTDRRASALRTIALRESEIERLNTVAQAFGIHATLPPEHGDVLPPIGSDVYIRHGRDDDKHLCTVVGYFAWPDLGGQKHLQRVFVRVHYKGTTTPNARLLCEVEPVAVPA